MNTNRTVKQHHWGSVIDNAPTMPIYSVEQVRRLRSIALNLAAWVESHCDAAPALLSEIQELKEIVNGERK
jgi:hypothetical protein